MVTMRIRRLTGGLALSVLVVLSGCRSTQIGPVAVADGIDVSANEAAAFAVGVVPTLAPPIRIGTPIGFRLSSSLAGLGHLYLIDATGTVMVLAENLPLAAGGQLEFPGPATGFTITATRPPGVNRVILLVTLNPFVGFANMQGIPLTSPVSLTLEAEEFLRRLGVATGDLPGAAWATAETRVQVVG